MSDRDAADLTAFPLALFQPARTIADSIEKRNLGVVWASR